MIKIIILIIRIIVFNVENSCAASYFFVETMIHLISVFLMNRMFRRGAFNWNIYFFVISMFLLSGFNHSFWIKYIHFIFLYISYWPQCFEQYCIKVMH